MRADADSRYPICCSVYRHLYRRYHSCCVSLTNVECGYTCRLIKSEPYNYNPLIIGVVILSFGAGNMVGSVAGGKWSDVYLRRLREANNGVSVPEVSPDHPHIDTTTDEQMRLKGTVWFMPVLVASFLTYAWTAGSHVNIAGIVISLFFAGLSVMLIYASTLAYLVDSNPVSHPVYTLDMC
jgi:MFS family permease